MQALLPDFENTEDAFAHRSNIELARDYAIFRMMNYQKLVHFGVETASILLKAGIVAPLAIGMKPTVYSIFCGGETLEKSTPKINHLHKYGVDSILDYGVEGKESEEDFNRTAQEIIKAIQFAKNNDATKIVCSKFTGLIPFSTLEKIHAEQPLSSAEQKIYLNCVDRIKSICDEAYKNDVALFVDAEESWIQKPLDDLTFSLMKIYNKEKPIIYNTIQLYLKDRLTYFKEAHSTAKKDGFIYAAKLVRGAYMEKESARSVKLNYPNPLQSSKVDTDKDYNSAVKFAIQNLESIAVCVATHNQESCLLAVELMLEKGLTAQHPHIHFSQLLGMSDNLTFNLAKAGFNASKYMPYGPVRDVTPYLIRRAQENTSVSGQMGRELQLLRTEMKRRKLPVW